jgi:hypothetical protein
VARLYVRRASLYGARPHHFVLYSSRLSDQRSMLRSGALCSHVRSSDMLGPGAL